MTAQTPSTRRKGETVSKRPHWFPVRTDAKWLARIRAEYSEDTEGLSDDAIRDKYADGWKYADTWDHLGDARASYEPLADDYITLLERLEEIVKHLRDEVTHHKALISRGPVGGVGEEARLAAHKASIADSIDAVRRRLS